MYFTISKKNIFKIFFVLALVVCAAKFVWSGAVNSASLLTDTQPRKLPIYSVETSEKKISLGINCAWDAADIPVLLELLAKEDIKATFFVAGSWVTNYPEELALIHAAGHEIGSHSNSHRDMTTLTPEQIRDEARASAALIKAVTGTAPTLFRMPSGAYDNKVISTLEEEGYIPIQFSVDSVDWKNPTPEQMAEKVISKTENGSIMLFHSGAENTPAALPIIISALKEKGYEFLPVGRLIHPKTGYIDHTGRQFPE